MSEKYTSFDPVLERFREISHLEHYWCSLLDHVFLRPLFAAAALTKYAHRVEELGVLHETILEHLCARKNHPLRKASHRLSRVLRFLDLESHRTFKYQGYGHGTTREQPKFSRPGDSLAARAGDIDGHFRCSKKLQDFWVQFPSDTRSAKQLLTLVPESVIKLRLKVPQQCNAFGTNGQIEPQRLKEPQNRLLQILKTQRSFDQRRSGCGKAQALPLAPRHEISGLGSRLNHCSAHRPAFSRLDKLSSRCPLTTQAIVDCGHRLKLLLAPRCHRLSSNSLLSILCATAGLWLFDEMNKESTNAPQTVSDPFDLAEDMIEADCSRANQELSLGVYTMEMTLESGMNELAPIKNMETPTIASTNRMIGIPELEWLVDYWPRWIPTIGSLRTTRTETMPGTLPSVRV
ncbi:MAG: hypothetical protein BYD32DRAFT_490241 [Podila humilis]|nr:MAG: hypothetical protein BYD32DRAFT_490241 [Podila humilis]